MVKIDLAAAVRKIAEDYGHAMYDAGMDANSDFSDRRHDGDRKRDEANAELSEALASLAAQEGRSQ